MGWTIRYAARIRKEVERVDPVTRRRIRRFLEERLAGLEDPRSLGRPLAGGKDGLWRYRVGPYRIICQLEDQNLVVLVLRIGHRRDVYR
ncbi:MAG: type II toxin-antitoxin system RelE/ParE family toxin [Gammaproteobacteria bacterium]|nr:MAG: type II toxin-antitoxin system RelE/ParE family toxin [Gammaproteobacteria bacterium]